MVYVAFYGGCDFAYPFVKFILVLAPKSICGTKATGGNNFKFVIAYVNMCVPQFVQDKFNPTLTPTNKFRQFFKGSFDVNA